MGMENPLSMDKVAEGVTRESHHREKESKGGRVPLSLFRDAPVISRLTFRKSLLNYRRTDEPMLHAMHEPNSPQHGELTPTRENYLRALFQLSRSGGGVRLTDLAGAQGVRLPTARHAVDCLRDAGCVQQESYGLITLTDEGRQRGRKLADRYELTRKFLIEVLGVGEDAAEREACMMEHHLDQDTLDRIAAFVRQVTGGTVESVNSEGSATC